jgi:creatinine amidohydrolase
MLADLTWQQAAGSEMNVLALPVGATEQHGPHLPLSTDTDIAAALAERLAAARSEVIVAPPVAYGSSGEHADFPGTLSIGADATARVLLELGRSASTSFSKLLLICAHGGNAGALHAATSVLTDEGRQVRAFVPRWGGDAHAGRTETSLMLALAPHRVHFERAEPGSRAALPDLLPRLQLDGVRAVSGNGVLGDPSGATAAEGRALLERAVSELSVLLDGWTTVR